MLMIRPGKLVLRCAAAFAVVAVGWAPVSAETPAPEVASPAPAANSARSVREDLAPQTFARLHTLIRPHDNEWRHLRVEWLTDVIAARRKATAEDKPIVILYTGGAGYNEPLGVC
jgi:hypothetical protein